MDKIPVPATDRAQNAAGVLPKMPQPQFLFVDGMRKSYSSAIRAHVLKGHFKKQRANVRYIKVSETCGAGHLTAYRLPQRCICPASKGDGSPTSVGRDFIISIDETESDEDLEQYNLPEIQSSLIGAGRIDPFSTYARTTTARENELLDFYVGDLVRVFQTSTSAIHPPRDMIFPVNITGQAGMESTFYYALRHMQSRGADVQPQEVWKYRLRAIHSINDALSDSRLRFSDSTIMAILGFCFILLELDPVQRSHAKLEGHTELAVHLRGLSQVVQSAGGFANIMPKAELSWVLHLADIVSYGSISRGTTPISIHAFHPATHLKLDQWTFQSRILYKEDFCLVFEEFVGVYKALYLLAETQFLDSKAGSERLHLLFVSGTQIYRLITSSNDLSPVDSIQIILYLSLIVLEYAPLGPTRLWDFFLRIRKSMVDQNLDVSGSRFVLLWVLITDSSGCRLDNPARVQLLCRLCWVLRRLSLVLRKKLQEFLMWHLTGDKMRAEGLIDPETFRRAVMEDLRLRCGCR